MKITSRYLEDNLVGADSVGKKRDGSGNFVIRRGYFYTGGMDADKFAESISKQMNEMNINHTVVGQGDHWAPFKGGASIAKQSHFWVEVSVG